MGRKKHNKIENEGKKGTIKPAIKEEKKEKIEVLEEEQKKEEIKDEVKEVLVEEKTPENKTCGVNTKIGAVLMLFVALVIIVGGLFFAYSSVKSPKAVYTKAINKVFSFYDEKYKKFDSTYGQFNIQEDAIVVDTSLKFSTNMEELLMDEGREIEGVNFSGQMGLDYKKNQLQLSGTIKGDKEKLTADLFTQGKKTILSTNIYEKFIDMTDDIDIYHFIKEFKSLVEEEEFALSPCSYEDYHYLSTTVEKALIKSLESSKMSKESAKYEILDEEIKGTKYTYTIDSKTYSKMTKSVITTLLDDKKFIKTAAKAYNIDKDKIIDLLKEIREDAKDMDIDKFKVNIYTSGILEEIRGIEFYSKYDDYENSFAIFTKDDNYQIRTVDYDEEFIFKIEKEDDEYKVKARYEGETVLTATVKELSLDKIDIEYSIKEYDTTSEGKIYLAVESEDDKLSLDYKLNIKYEDDYYDEEQYFDSEGKVKIEKVDKLPEKEVKDPVDIYDVDEEELYNNMKKIVENDPVLNNLFGYLFEEIEDPDPCSDCTLDELHIMDLADRYQMQFGVGIDPDYERKSVTVDELTDDEIIETIVSRIFSNEKRECISVYEEDKEECFYIEEDEFYDSIGYREVYTYEVIKNVAKVNFGRDINIENLNLKELEDEHKKLTRCAEKSSYCVIEYNNETYFYSVNGGYAWGYKPVEVESITSNGNIYTVVIRVEDSSIEEEFQVEFQFELLTNESLEYIKPEDIRFISIKVI